MKKIVKQFLVTTRKTLQVILLSIGIFLCAQKLWEMRSADYGHLTQYPGIPDNPVVLSSHSGDYMLFAVIILVLASTAAGILKKKPRLI